MFDTLKQIIQQMQEGKKISTTEEFDRIIKSFGMSWKIFTTYLEGKKFCSRDLDKYYISIFSSV